MAKTSTTPGSIVSKAMARQRAQQAAADGFALRTFRGWMDRVEAEARVAKSGGTVSQELANGIPPKDRDLRAEILALQRILAAQLEAEGVNPLGDSAAAVYAAFVEAEGREPAPDDDEYWIALARLEAAAYDGS